MANNTNTLRRLSLPPNLCARLPVRLFDSLTHLHMNMDYAPYPSDAELDLNFALRHTTRLESLSLPIHREREMISLYDNGNALTNLVSLQLRFHYEQLPPPDEDRLLYFLRERRGLRRLYLQFEESSDPVHCQKIFLLVKELPNLHVLGLNPCHLSLPDTIGVLQYSLADFLPPRLKAFHAKLPGQTPYSGHNLTLVTMHSFGCLRGGLIIAKAPRVQRIQSPHLYRPHFSKSGPAPTIQTCRARGR